MKRSKKPPQLRPGPHLKAGGEKIFCGFLAGIKQSLLRRFSGKRSAEDEIYVAMIRANNDARNLLQFYRSMLNSSLYVAAHYPELQVVRPDGSLSKGAKPEVILFEASGGYYMAAFTSLEAVQQAGFENLPILKLPGVMAFQTVPTGAGVVLNPRGKWGRAFSAGEVRMITKTSPAIV